MLSKLKKYFEKKNKPTHELVKNMTRDIILTCNKCKKRRILIIPHMARTVNGKTEYGLCFGDIIKYCLKCKSIFIGLGEHEYWVFKKDWWKNIASTVEKYFEKESALEKLHSYKVVRGDLTKKEKCECGKDLKEYNFECLECDGKMSFSF